MVPVTGIAFDLMTMAPTLDRSVAVPEYILILHQAPMTLTPSKSRCVHIISAFCVVCLALVVWAVSGSASSGNSGGGGSECALPTCRTEDWVTGARIWIKHSRWDRGIGLLRLYIAQVAVMWIMQNPGLSGEKKLSTFFWKPKASQVTGGAQLCLILAGVKGGREKMAISGKSPSQQLPWEPDLAGQLQCLSWCCE